MWHASEDVFTFVSHVTKQEYEWTKRNLLRKIVTLFVPLGLLAPLLIRVKMLVWILG